MNRETFGAYAMVVVECAGLDLQWPQIDAAIQSMLG